VDLALNNAVNVLEVLEMSVPNVTPDFIYKIIVVSIVVTMKVILLIPN
jgi:hypothetical protein